MILPIIFLTVISYFKKKFQDLHNMQCVLLIALSNCQHIFGFFFVFVFFQIDNFLCFIFKNPCDDG